MLDLFRRDAADGAGPAREAGRYRRTDAALVPFGDRGTLVRAEPGAPGLLVPHELADLLARCDELRTLDEHAATIAGALGLGGSEAAGLRRGLDELARLGLLDENDAVVSGLALPAEPPPPSVEALHVVTCARPAALERCLASHVEVARAAGRARGLTVLDDSPTEEAREATRAVVARTAARLGVTVGYEGPAERRALVEHLCRAGLPRPAMELALLDPEGLGETGGANRNHGTLLGAGRPSVCVDDDTTARLARPPSASPGLAVSSVYDPTELWLWPDAEGALAGVALEPRDVVACHEDLLGRRPAPREEGGLDVETASPELLGRLRRPGAPRVVATATGLVGDSGMYAPTYFLALRGQSRERLVESYDELRLTRGVLRAAPRPTVGDGAFLISPTLGLDCRGVVPPFFPAMRNVDGLLGAVLRAAGLGLIGHLPFAVEHRPPEARSFREEDMTRRPAALRTTDVLQLCLRALPVGAAPAEPGDRLRRVGRHLASLGALPLAELEEVVRLERWRLMGALADDLVELLDRYGGRPRRWAEDVEAVLDAVASSLLGDRAAVPDELVERRGLDEARRLTKRLVRGYGQLLEAWPDALEVAAGLDRER